MMKVKGRIDLFKERHKANCEKYGAVKFNILFFTAFAWLPVLILINWTGVALEFIGESLQKICSL